MSVQNPKKLDRLTTSLSKNVMTVGIEDTFLSLLLLLLLSELALITGINIISI
jgi:hypothetical protein